MPTTENTRSQTLTQLFIVAIVGTTLAMTLYFGSLTNNKRFAPGTPDLQPASQPIANATVIAGKPHQIRFNTGIRPIILVPRHTVIDTTDVDTKAFIELQQTTFILRNGLSPDCFPPDIVGAPEDPTTRPPQAKIID